MTNLPTLPQGGQLPADPQQMQDLYRQYAQAYSETEPVSGQSIRANNGVMMLGDQAIPGNQFAAIILDAAHLNTYFGSSYNPNVILPPICYAVARTEMEMAPHPDMQKDLNYFKPQAERCGPCPHNQFGSARQGEGKACQNRRRLVLIVAGTYPQGQLVPINDLSHYGTTPLLTLTLPPTSAKNWGRFVREAAGTYNRPPFGVITRVYLYPHEKHGREAFGFDILAPVPDDWGQIMFKRLSEGQQEVMRGYDPPQQGQQGAQGYAQAQQPGGGFYGAQQAAQPPQQGWQQGPGAPGYGQAPGYR